MTPFPGTKTRAQGHATTCHAERRAISNRSFLFTRAYRCATASCIQHGAGGVRAMYVGMCADEEHKMMRRTRVHPGLHPSRAISHPSHSTSCTVMSVSQTTTVLTRGVR